MSFYFQLVKDVSSFTKVRSLQNWKLTVYESSFVVKVKNYLLRRSYEWELLFRGPFNKGSGTWQ